MFDLNKCIENYANEKACEKLGEVIEILNKNIESHERLIETRMTERYKEDERLMMCVYREILRDVQMVRKKCRNVRIMSLSKAIEYLKVKIVLMPKGCEVRKEYEQLMKWLEELQMYREGREIGWDPNK